MRCFNRRPRVLCKEARNNPGFSCKTRLIQAAPAWPLIVMSIKTSGEQLSLSSFSHCVEHPRRHERATRVGEMRTLLRRSAADRIIVELSGSGTLPLASTLKGVYRRS